MNPILNFFKENHYVVLSDTITKERCAQLTKHMFDLFESGKLEKDTQCPLSDSIYSDPEFDRLLEELAAPLSTQLQTELLPAYTYARIYRNGEKLKWHIDRPSCEYSATLTLGYDGTNPWPIYVGKNTDDYVGKRVDLDIAEMLVYEGTKLPHWRPEFKGQWQVQVFFHYVDKNGPYKEFANDKRGALSHHAHEDHEHGEHPTVDKSVDEKTQVADFEHQDTVRGNHDAGILLSTSYNAIALNREYQYVPGSFFISTKSLPELAFTAQECDQIIGLASEMYAEPASVGMDREAQIVESVRKVDVYNIECKPETKWIFEKITKAVAYVNQVYFGYDVSHINHALQLLHYKSTTQIPGHYNWHSDFGPGKASTRKISLSVQLSGDVDYAGGELELMEYGGLSVAPKEKGAIVLFPSFMPHQVKPVTAGERWALVIWVHGGDRFR